MRNMLAAARRRLIGLGLRVLMALNKVLTALGVKRVYYAEYFTDRYVRENFFPDFNYRGVVLEVGCATPNVLSMSQHFRQNGWRCIGIEPNPLFVNLHKEAGNEVYAYAAADFEKDDVDFVVVEESDAYSTNSLTAHSYSSLAIKEQYENYRDNAIDLLKKRNIKVSVRKLDTILALHTPEVSQIDLMSVDVEGFELEVVRGLSFETHPVKVIVLENLFYDDAYVEYMKTRGYRFHSRVHYNYIFVPDVA